MNSLKIALRVIILLLVVSGCTKPDNETKASKVSIKTIIDLTKVVDDKVPVEINPGVFYQDSVIFRLPRIVQGVYWQVHNFGNFIDDFKAVDYNGNELEVTKFDANSWMIINGKQLDEIHYNVNDTFDAEGGEFPVPIVAAGTNFEEDNFVLNLHGLIGYFDSLKQNEYNLDIIYPSHFKSSSALTVIAEIEHENNTVTKSYFAKRYFDITDNPMFYGDLDIEEFKIDNITIGLTVYSPSKKHTAANIKESVAETMRAQKLYLGDLNTTTRYDIFLFLSRADETSPTHGFGALEHHTSTIVTRVDSLSSEKLIKSIKGTISHEFFHTLTPLSVHSEDIHYYDYNSPTMSKHLWMYEGLTSYLTAQFQINQGLFDKKEYYEKISSILQRTLNYDDTLSLTEISENILDEPYNSNYGNVYQKGALINMCADILIREGSNGKKGILSIMKELSLKYGKDKPFDDDAIIDEMVSMTYPSVGEFFNNHVIGNTPINYADIFDKVGLVLNESKIETDYFAPKSFSWTDEIIFFSGGVNNNSSWDEQEVQAYDVIKSIGGDELSSENMWDIYWKYIGHGKPKDDFEMVLIRNGKEINVNITLTQAYKSEFSLSENENATESQKALRESWLKG